MNIALVTKGVIGGFIATGGGDGEPYPLPIEDVEITTYDIKGPILDVDTEQEEATPIGFDEVEEYLPNKKSGVDILPTVGTTNLPKPGNL